METSTNGTQEAFSLLSYARNLGFTDAQYEGAVRRIKSQDANQLLMALLEVSGGQDQVESSTDTQCDVQHCETSSTSAGTSGHSSTPSFASVSTASSSSQSLDSLNSQQVASAHIPTQSDSLQSAVTLPSGCKLRRIYIDGSNVARTHGFNAQFSWRGIKICVDWFRRRGHEVKVIVPEDKCASDQTDAQVLSDLDESGVLIRTPKESNDDMFIIDAARERDGIIVSNDQFRDECRRFGSTDYLDRFIYLNTLRYVFDDDTFIPAKDPRGRCGPKLDDFLQFQPGRERQDYREYLHRMRAQPSRSLPNRLHPMIVEDKVSQPPVDTLISISQCNQRLTADRSGRNLTIGYSSHHSRTKPQTGQAKVARFQVGRTKSHNF